VHIFFDNLSGIAVNGSKSMFTVLFKPRLILAEEFCAGLIKALAYLNWT